MPSTHLMFDRNWKKNTMIPLLCVMLALKNIQSLLKIVLHFTKHSVLWKRAMKTRQDPCYKLEVKEDFSKEETFKQNRKGWENFA